MYVCICTLTFTNMFIHNLPLYIRIHGLLHIHLHTQTDTYIHILSQTRAHAHNHTCIVHAQMHEVSTRVHHAEGRHSRQSETERCESVALSWEPCRDWGSEGVNAEPRDSIKTAPFIIRTFPNIYGILDQGVLEPRGTKGCSWNVSCQSPEIFRKMNCR